MLSIYRTAVGDSVKRRSWVEVLADMGAVRLSTLRGARVLALPGWVLPGQGQASRSDSI